jgi:hypothetical protein
MKFEHWIYLEIYLIYLFDVMSVVILYYRVDQIQDSFYIFIVVVEVNLF